MIWHRSLILCFGLCLSFAGVASRTPAEEPAKQTTAKAESNTELEGRWHPIGESKNGQPWIDQKRDFICMVFSKRELTIRFRAAYRAATQNIITCDATKTPKQIDMHIPAKGDQPAQTKLGIYQLKDQELILAWSGVAGVRPTSFEPAADVTLYRLKQPEISKLAKDFEGAWVVVSAEDNGKAIKLNSEKPEIFVFEEGVTGTDSGDVNPNLGKSYQLAERNNVLEIDFSEEGDKPGTTEVCRGIYEIKDGTLTICVGVKPETPRPTKLAAPQGSDLYLMKLKRKE